MNKQNVGAIDPLIGLDVDLRDFDFMPFYGNRLFKSDTWILCDAEERVAAIRLWWACWHEEPAGSLPSNDRLLADLAGYGVAVKAFLAVKENAMRGWILCSDGRLYHPVVCEIAEDVWKKKRKKVSENAAERERKRRKRGACPPDNNGSSSGQTENSAGQEHNEDDLSGKNPAENALNGNGFESQESPPVSPPPGGKRTGTRLPDDWKPTDIDFTYAHGLGYSDDEIAKHAKRFLTYWTAGKGRNATNSRWDQAWENWIDKEQPKNPAPKQSTASIAPPAHDLAKKLKALGVPAGDIASWINPLKVEFNDGACFVIAPTAFIRDKAQVAYADQISRALDATDIRFEVRR